MADISQLVLNNETYNFKDAEGRTQVSTMPTASADLLGKIVQFTGTTGSGYTNGYFYKCTEPTSGTYTWEEINVQAGGGGGSYVDIRTTDPANPSTGQMWVLVSS